MVNRDYTKEVGLKSGAPMVSWPVAVILLALGGASMLFGLAQVRARPEAAKSVPEASAAAAKAKPASAPHAAHR